MSEEEDPIAHSLRLVARAIDRLGNADAATPMGGLEALGVAIENAAECIAAPLSLIAEVLKDESATSHALDRVADALDRIADALLTTKEKE